MRIAITDNHRPKHYFDNYLKWVHRIEPAVEFVKLSYHLKNAGSINDVDALILTGGGDVHPKFYNRPEAVEYTEEVNELRDEFELKVIERALELELPILGICRGMQIMNVALGGTLVTDLVAAGYVNHAQQDGQENRHILRKVPHSLLEAVCGRGNESVNSIHHQAVEQPGRGLMVSAVSPDGVIEAAEWIIKDRMPLLLLVQWHPERMHDFDNPHSRNLVEYFLREVQHSLKTHSHHHSSNEERS